VVFYAVVSGQAGELELQLPIRYFSIDRVVESEQPYKFWFEVILFAAVGIGLSGYSALNLIREWHAKKSGKTVTIRMA
jgi:hypothetical protein